MQKPRVPVNLLPIARINLQIPNQMRNHIPEQKYARHSHDHLLANGSVVKPDGAMNRRNRDCAHADVLVDSMIVINAMPVRGAKMGGKGINFQYAALKGAGGRSGKAKRAEPREGPCPK